VACLPIGAAAALRLFLVFNTVPGGATGNNLFNLNWLEFADAGVGTPSRQPPSRVPTRLPGCPVRG
jgi:hypothetical protein